MSSDHTSTTGQFRAPVIRAAWVDRPVAEAFIVFTEEIGAWWPLPTHGLFGESSGNVAFRDGLMVEQSTDGTEAVWGEITAWEPPSRLVFSWHPGREKPDSSEVEVVFESDGAGTRVTIEHRGWEAFGANALTRRRGYVGPDAWGYVLDHYGDGAEARPDAVDVRNLAAAYEKFYSEAERGGFGPAPVGEWSVEQTVAHVALNDLAMLAVCQTLVHGGSARFENSVCQDLEVLARWVDRHGDLAGLIIAGREMSGLVLAALVRLSLEQRDTLVDCHLIHDGQVMLDEPRGWESVAVDTQTEVHLPAHGQQLRDLRG